MRWSQILSISIFIQSFFSVLCAAIAIPLSSIDLERRSSGPKASSKTYRKASKQHPAAYDFDQSTGVTRTKLDPKDITANGEKRLQEPNTDADHVYEIQMFNDHVIESDLDYQKLDPNLRKEAKNVLNGPANVAPIPGSINKSKGQLWKGAIAGQSVTPRPDRDQYIGLSYPTAKKTAKNLNAAFQNHPKGKYKAVDFHAHLRDKAEKAGILKPGEPSPKGSSEEASSKHQSSGGSASSAGSARSRKSSLSGSSDAGKTSLSQQASSAGQSTAHQGKGKAKAKGKGKAKGKSPVRQTVPTRSSQRIADQKLKGK